MDNIDMTIDGDTLIIKVDLSKEICASASGKTIRVASTRGNIDVPGRDGMKIGLNVFKYPPR